jgi:integrase
MERTTMPAYRDLRSGVWRYRKQIRLPDGSRVRIEGTPNLKTKEAAEKAEREHIIRLEESIRNPQAPAKEVPTFEKFAPEFLTLCATQNKPSALEAKESILRVHLTPAFGPKPLDRIGFAEIQDYVAIKIKKGLSKKTVNNHLTVLRRLLVVAKKRGELKAVPEIEWLKAPKPDFDFLSFDEAERLVTATDPGWRCMVKVAVKTGLRQGELIALRWEDIDLVKGLLRVRRSATRGVVTVPKSGKGRDVALGDEAIAVLKAERHLRGPLVFCNQDGRMWKKNECKHPIWRACKKAGLRQVSWHVLRHTFASHLVMRGAAMKVVQELLGHATMEMTMRYAHLSPDVPRQAVKLLDGLSNGTGPWRQAGDKA